MRKFDSFTFLTLVFVALKLSLFLNETINILLSIKFNKKRYLLGLRRERILFAETVKIQSSINKSLKIKKFSYENLNCEFVVPRYEHGCHK